MSHIECFFFIFTFQQFDGQSQYGPWNCEPIISR